MGAVGQRDRGCVGHRTDAAVFVDTYRSAPAATYTIVELLGSTAIGLALDEVLPGTTGKPVAAAAGNAQVAPPSEVTMSDWLSRA
jgi:hypothetical protein